MKKITLYFIIITMFSKLIGFARELILAYYYGVSAISDAYIISFTIPAFLMGIFAKSISTTFIPQFSSIESEIGKDEAIKYTNNIINIVNIIVTLIVLFALVFTKFLVSLFVSGFTDDALILTISFTRITIFSTYLLFMVNIYSAYLQKQKKFLVTAVIGIPQSIILAISIILSAKYSIYFMPIGILLSTFFQSVILLVFVYKTGYRHHVVVNFKDKHVADTFRMAAPMMIGLLLTQLNGVVDKTIASGIIEGGIASLTLSRYIIDVIIAVFVLSVGTIIFPRISEEASKNNLDYLGEILLDTLSYVFLIIVPCSLGFLYFSEDIIKIVFMRGAFVQRDVLLTSGSLFFYSIGMLAFSLKIIIYDFYFAMKDTLTPNLMLVVSLLINVILSLYLSKYMGVSGIALATSISMILSVFVLFILLIKKIKVSNYQPTLKSIVKVIISSGIMIVSIIYFDYSFEFVNFALRIIVLVTVGILSYGISLILLHEAKTILILKQIKKIFL